MHNNIVRLFDDETMNENDKFAANLALLTGRLSDVLTPASDMIKQLRLRSNSTTTRQELAYLVRRETAEALVAAQGQMGGSP